jgi:hypothetical protein
VYLRARDSTCKASAFPARGPGKSAGAVTLMTGWVPKSSRTLMREVRLPGNWGKETDRAGHGSRATV